MRWIRFEDDHGQQIGFMVNDKIQPVKAGSLNEIIVGKGREPTGASSKIDDVTILSPLRPPKLVCVGLNYMDHVREQGGKPPEQPLLFSKYPTSVIGPNEAVRWPEGLTTQVDFEVELAVIIGKRARLVEEKEALEYVFGYTTANDVSARDLQFGDGQWTRGKSLDTFCPLGPAIVTADEIADPQNLPLVCRVNGVTYQDSNTSEMIFPVATLIAYISRAYTLEPGDVILTGTPDGVGVFRDPKVFVKPGDVMEVEVADFGVLRNPVGPTL